MKIVLASLSLLLFSALAAGQSPAPPKPATELETFQGKVGSVFIKGYTDGTPLRGSNGTIEVDPMEFTDAQTKVKVTGIVVEVASVSGSYSTVRRARSFVDLAEIDGLLQGIDYIAKADATVTHLKNFEATFRTKGDLKIVVFNQSSGEIGVSVECGRISTESVFLKLADLMALRQLIVDARAMLGK